MEQPSSPGTGPLAFRDCVEELLHFTLNSQINQTLEIDLGLSTQFCSFLLQHDDVPQNTVSGQAYDHPLYKQLASALYKCINSGVFCERFSKTASLNEDNELKERVKWNDLILVQGTNLLNSLKTVDFELHVQEIFFTQLKDGLKTVEGRCAVGDYNSVGSGAWLLFDKCVVVQFQDVRRYASFSEMLEAEGLEKVLPGIKTINEGVQVYINFYAEEKERANGVLAICVASTSTQPYIPLARILAVDLY